eukprot:CAMPEP_0178958884 /NCGR_PEP_ID=MMETSP0789-20121207/11922_1 /TAXON_ID=3005 /ORGANISM="Rhizosolenia setigera, Strain CCMP 1694" /LENGTH=658 /DNA_ID=CAMNT_0020641703 /DNA_START=106 /DNA_END=2085 /DNA_ORIENTATION=-
MNDIIHNNSSPVEESNSSSSSPLSGSDSQSESELSSQYSHYESDEELLPWSDDYMSEDSDDSDSSSSVYSSESSSIDNDSRCSNDTSRIENLSSINNIRTQESPSASKKSNLVSPLIPSKQSELVQRKQAHKQIKPEIYSGNQFDDDKNIGSKRRDKYRSKRNLVNSNNYAITSCFQSCYQSCPALLSLNSFLRFSIFLWILAQGRHLYYSSKGNDMVHHDDDYYSYINLKKRKYTDGRKHPLSKDEEKRIQQMNKEKAMNALGSAAANDDERNKDKNSWWNTGRLKGPKKKKSVEDLSPNCSYQKWQTVSYPTCNSMHEIDLGTALGMEKFGTKLPGDLLGENSIPVDVLEGEDSTHYVGSGLWRNVWRVSDSFGALERFSSVLKMMKIDVEVDERNIDRHRRDAITMERFTSNPNVVSIYGYCANNVLIQYVGMGLDKMIYRNVDDRSGNFTRKTPLGRLQLALEVARGIAALHETNSGTNTPIVHADIQAKQYLVDGKNGHIVLNDFNRCRFLGMHEKSYQACPTRIPSAPGDFRSPEEYHKDFVDEKLDIFSVGHVLHGIMTGRKKPFSKDIGNVPNYVKQGGKPEISSGYFQSPSDKELANLIMETYRHNPQKRISASELVSELENLIVEEKKRLGSERNIRGSRNANEDNKT